MITENCISQLIINACVSTTKPFASRYVLLNFVFITHAYDETVIRIMYPRNIHCYYYGTLRPMV